MDNICFSMKISLFAILLTMISCTKKLENLNRFPAPEPPVAAISVSKVEFKDQSLLIVGHNLSFITRAFLQYNSEKIELEKIASSNERVTFQMKGLELASGLIIKSISRLILDSASASTQVPIDLSLCDSLLGNGKINCSLAAANNDVLSFDAASNSWTPKAISALKYLGLFDASGVSLPSSDSHSSGEYYIVNTPGTISGISYDIGDWIIFNGSAWDKISNSSSVSTVFGRKGAVVAQKGDYALNLLSDIDFSLAPVSGDILSFDDVKKKWVPTKKEPGASPISSTDELTEGVKNFYFSQDRVLATPIKEINLNNAELTITDDIKTAFGKLQAQIKAKDSLPASGTATQYLKGDKTWGEFYTNVLATLLSGFQALPGVISSSDSFLTAIGKLAGNQDLFIQKNAEVQFNNNVKVVSPGMLTIPSPTGVVLDEAVNVQFLNNSLSNNEAWKWNPTNINILKKKLGINKSQIRASLDVNGQIVSTTASVTTASIDWSLGNVITTTADCSTPINFSNFLDGGSYTLAVTSTTTNTCIFSGTTTGSDASTVLYRFSPTNAARTANSHTIYSIIRVGNIAYVSWISGF